MPTEVWIAGFGCSAAPSPRVRTPPAPPARLINTRPGARARACASSSAATTEVTSATPRRPRQLRASPRTPSPHPVSSGAAFASSEPHSEPKRCDDVASPCATPTLPASPPTLSWRILQDPAWRQRAGRDGRARRLPSGDARLMAASLWTRALRPCRVSTEGPPRPAYHTSSDLLVPKTEDKCLGSCSTNPFSIFEASQCSLSNPVTNPPENRKAFAK